MQSGCTLQRSNRTPLAASRSRLGVWYDCAAVGAERFVAEVVGQDEDDVRRPGVGRAARTH